MVKPGFTHTACLRSKSVLSFLWTACREREPTLNGQVFSILLELGHSRLAPLREGRSLLFSKAAPAFCSCLGWRPWTTHRKPILQRRPDTAPSSFWACFRKPQPASCVSPLLSQPHHTQNTLTVLVTPDVGGLVPLSSSLSPQQSGLRLSSTLCFLINLFLFKKYIFCWSIVDLQCFRSTARWFWYKYTYIYYFWIIHILFLKLFSSIGYYKILIMVPCAIYSKPVWLVALSIF